MTSPLITPEELQDLRGSAVTLLDVRYQQGRADGREAYEAGHVPGAAYVDLDADLAARPGPGGRHPLPDREAFGEAMRRCGVATGAPVVVYDDWGSFAAARCWWLLRHHGHPDVRVLDGGWSAWQASGGDVRDGEETVEPGDFEPTPGRLPTVDAEQVPEWAAAGRLVDVRAPERYRGEIEPIDRVAGHVPGALNVPLAAHSREGRAEPEVAADYPEGEVAVMCGSGVTAAYAALVLAAAGREAVLYPGSWSGWIADPGRPVAAGGQEG